MSVRCGAISVAAAAAVWTAQLGTVAAPLPGGLSARDEAATDGGETLDPAARATRLWSARTIAPSDPCAEAEEAPRGAVIELAVGDEVSWDCHEGSRRYRAGNLDIVMRRSAADRNAYEAVVSQAGRRSLVVNTGVVTSNGCCSLSLGRLDRSGARYVMVGSYTGGSHCCWQIHLALPDGPRRRAVTVGAFDVPPNLGTETTGVRDFDGDGRVDFAMGDDAFLYRFASYSGSSAPLAIYNVIDGRVVNVSAARRFRPLHLRELPSLRTECREATPGFRNSACAAYVATAARIGRFDEAWRDMMEHHRRDDLFEGVAFPERLRSFLIERGYVER